MAVFRKINTNFWQDPLVLDFTPEEKYFYLYLMTNTKTNQCGIYEIPKKVMEMETGYNRETIDKLIERFVSYRKIIYSTETNEIMIINWIKYNGSSSPKVISRVESELKEIKNKKLVEKYIYLSKELNYQLDTVSILYPYSIDTESQKEEEKEEEKEEVEEQEEEKEAGSSNSYPQEVTNNLSNQKLSIIANAYEQNGLGPLSPIVQQELIALLDEYDTTWINEAIKIAVTSNKRNLKYVKGILKNWRTNGGMTLVNDNQAVKKPNSIPRKKTRFHTAESRTDKYSEQQLEEVAKQKRLSKPPSGSGLAFLEQFKD